MDSVFTVLYCLQVCFPLLNDVVFFALPYSGQQVSLLSFCFSEIKFFMVLRRFVVINTYQMLSVNNVNTELNTGCNVKLIYLCVF